MIHADDRTAALDVIVQIWRGVLGVEHIAEDQDFFESGGDSLLAMFAADAISNELSVPLSLHDLYAHPTIRRLCDHIATLARPAALAR